MGIRRKFQEGVRTSVIDFMPDVQFYFVDTNGHEQITPYCTIEIVNFDSVGREEISTWVSGGGPTENGVLAIRENYESTVRFTFMGKNESGNDAGDDVLELSTLLLTPLLQMKFRENNLSYRRKAIVRRIPKFRETRWYDAYVLDVVFGFCIERTQQIDSVESISITGHFQPDNNRTIEITIP